MSSPLIPRLTDWHGAAQLHPYFVCDVFTSQPLQGNRLGVFVDGRPFTPEQMQSLAREMNFAETVFKGHGHSLSGRPEHIRAGLAVPSTSRVPMVMQYTDQYVYYGP